MFPFPWNSPAWMGTVSINLDQMWNSMWNPSTSAAPPHQGTPGQIYGGDSHLQQQAQSQAQTQAQINALQQQNALLNQPLASQSMSHIHDLQQLLPQQSTNTPQPQAHSPQVPVQPEPPSPKAQPEVTPSTSLPFNTDEMLKKLRSNVQEDLEMARSSRNLNCLHRHHLLPFSQVHHHHRHFLVSSSLQISLVHHTLHVGHAPQYRSENPIGTKTSHLIASKPTTSACQVDGLLQALPWGLCASSISIARSTLLQL